MDDINLASFRSKFGVLPAGNLFEQGCNLETILFVGLVLMIFITVYVTYNSIFVNGYSQQQNYSFAFKWGSKGINDGQFMRPHDIEFDSFGNVYVSDRDLNNVQKFTAEGKFILKWGSTGQNDGQFKVPYSISVDDSDNLYVVDKDNNRVQKFYPNGTFIQKWYSPQNSSIYDNFNVPEDMAIDPSSGAIYVADTGNNRIVKVDRNFNLILQWGSEGFGKGEFVHPHGIGVDKSGNVYVNEINATRIQKFDSQGRFIKQWGSYGTGEGQFKIPLEHLFVDVWVSVWQVDGEHNPRVQKFDNNGTFITSVGTGPCIIKEEVKIDALKMSEPLPCDGKLHQPEHANMDSAGNLYVVDRGNQRIVVFSPDS